MTAESEAPPKSLLTFFGRDLRRVRLEAGLTQEEAAALSATSQSLLSKIEAAKRVPTGEDADAFDAAFGTGGHFGRLYPLVVAYAYPSWFLPFIELEREATSMRVFESQIIPGLLQTEEYARAMLAAVRPDNLSDLVAARMTRQAVFDREELPHTWFIVDEQALHRRIGGPQVMRAQLERLLRAVERPRTVLQVVPRPVASHPGLAGPFTLLSFDEGADVLYVDGFSQGRIALDAAEVGEGVRSYDLLRAAALSPDASAELIGDLLKELER